MTDQNSSESGVMRAAANAQSKVSSWSASKQEFANRVTNKGSFNSERPGSIPKDDADHKA